MKGSYIEVVPVDPACPAGETRAIRRDEGAFAFRRSGTMAHRIELLPDERWTEFAKPLIVGERPVWTLFITGPNVRSWGFHCPKGWVHWRDFTAKDGLTVGRGCGETAEALSVAPRLPPGSAVMGALDTPPLDHVDIRILATLSEDGGLCRQDVAIRSGRRHGRSHSGLLRWRIRYLEDHGLVGRLDDRRPIAWARTPAGTAVLPVPAQEREVISPPETEVTDAR